MAHKKGVGSSKNGRESESKRLGVKLFGGEFAKAGNIIVRQRGTTHHPGENAGIGKDHTIYALIDGIVFFRKTKKNRSYVSVKSMVADPAIKTSGETDEVIVEVAETTIEPVVETIVETPESIIETVVETAIEPVVETAIESIETITEITETVVEAAAAEPVVEATAAETVVEAAVAEPVVEATAAEPVVEAAAAETVVEAAVETPETIAKPVTRKRKKPDTL